MTKICEDCQFFRASEFGPHYARCEYPQKIGVGVALVSRQANPSRRVCYLERLSNGPDSCGPEGKWFQPKPGAPDTAALVDGIAEDAA